MTKMTAKDKSEKAYNLLVNQLKWKQTSILNMAKFGVLMGYSIKKLQKESINPEVEMWNEDGKNIVENLNGPGGELFAKIIKAKYSRFDYWLYLNLKAIIFLAKYQFRIWFFK